MKAKLNAWEPGANLLPEEEPGGYYLRSNGGRWLVTLAATEYDRPMVRRWWWAIAGRGEALGPEDNHRRVGRETADGTTGRFILERSRWPIRMVIALEGGAQTKALAIEEIPVPQPPISRCRRWLRWFRGRWQRLSARGAWEAV